MRFGKWRGVPLALALAAIVGIGLDLVRADGWHLHYTIPREVPAYDFTTGGPYYAPPVPYGHYAKDYARRSRQGYRSAPWLRKHGTGALHGCLKDLWDKTVGLFHSARRVAGRPRFGCGIGRDTARPGARLRRPGSRRSRSHDCGFCSGRGLFGYGTGIGCGREMEERGSGVLDC